MSTKFNKRQLPDSTVYNDEETTFQAKVLLPIATPTNDKEAITFKFYKDEREEIDTEISLLKNPDRITVNAGYTLLGQDLTFNPDWKVVIDAVEYTNTAQVILNFPLASAGYSRLDLVAFTKDSTFVRVAGVESLTTPVAPTTPPDTVYITVVFVSDVSTKAPISSVHNPVTLGTANGLSLSTQQLSLGLASSGVTGALSGTDWNAFNNKQDALGYTPENVANKAIDFSVVDNVKYPTVQAVSNQLLESNKKWVLFGDSLSNTLLDPDYPFYVIQNLKLTGTVTNAVAGNTSADQLTILNSILTSTPTYFNYFDIASLLVGVNDWATNVPLGNRQSLITDANFAGRLKAIIEKIITAKPSIRLYVMTPFETNSMAAPYNSFNTEGYTLREMSVLISQICSDYSVQCIDLYSLSQLNLKTIPTFLSDGVHPNSVGAKFIGDIVAKAFLSNNNKGKLVDTGIKRKREDLYEEVDNNIYKIQKGSFQPSTIYDVDYKVGLGKSIPSIKLEVVSTTIDPAPVLGSGTKGVVSFLSNNSLYGEYIGSSNNGDTWHQVQRNDGAAVAYNMVMQPLGGNFIVGSLLDNGSKVQVNGTISASPATTANQVVVKSQLDAKFNTPTVLATNYLPKWNGSGFGNSQIFDNGTNIGIGTTNPTANLTVKGAYSVGSSIPTNWALLSAGRMGVAKNNKGLYFDIFNDYAEVSTYDWSLGQAYPMVFQGNGGNSMFGTNVDNGSKVQVNGTISASPATTANQVPTWGQVQAAARPYKVYTALLSQTGTNAPTATVLENTLGGTVTFSRNVAGSYLITLTNAFVQDKTFGQATLYTNTNTVYTGNHTFQLNRTNPNDVELRHVRNDVMSDGFAVAVEVRVYN